MGQPPRETLPRHSVGLDAFSQEGHVFLASFPRGVNPPVAENRNHHGFAPRRSVGPMKRVAFLHGPAAHGALMAVRRLDQGRGLALMLPAQRFQQILLPRSRHGLPLTRDLRETLASNPHARSAILGWARSEYPAKIEALAHGLGMVRRLDQADGVDDNPDSVVTVLT